MLYRTQDNKFVAICRYDFNTDNLFYKHIKELIIKTKIVDTQLNKSAPIKENTYSNVRAITKLFSNA